MFFNTVDAANNAHIVQRNARFGNDPGAHRAVSVQALAFKPLAAMAFLLDLTHGGVIECAVAKNKIHRHVFCDIAPPFANDDRQFRFPIGSVGVSGFKRDGSQGMVHRVHPLGEKYRVLGVTAHRLVGTSILPLFEMVQIVPADTVDIAVRTRYG